MSDQDQHLIVQKLKALALELGRTPRANDLIGIEGLSRHSVNRAFGTFAVAIQAAGLTLSRDKGKRKIGNEIFEVPLGPVLETARLHQEAPKPTNFLLPKYPYPKTLVLGDIHAPFHHTKAVKWVIDLIEKEKPERVVQVGDMKDFFSWASFPKSQNVFTPKEEFEAARKACSEIWEGVHRAAPKAECYALSGNHILRPMKRLFENCPELEIFIDMKPFLSYPGVELIMDDRSELVLDGLVFIHGYRSKLGDHRDYMNASVVTGHTHRGGVVFKNTWNGHQIYELNAGMLGDPTAKGLSYTAQKYTHWTLGCAMIDHLGPRFIPYIPAE